MDVEECVVGSAVNGVVMLFLGCCILLGTPFTLQDIAVLVQKLQVLDE